MKAKVKIAIEALAEKAKAAPAHEALHLTQSALNLAHALQVLRQTENWPSSR